MSETYTEVKCWRGAYLGLMANFESWKEMFKDSVMAKVAKNDEDLRMEWLQYRRLTRSELLLDLLIITCPDS